MRFFLLLTTILLFSSVSSFAQEKKWTLGECIRYAVEHSQSMERQTAQNEIYKQNFMGAIINQAPNIGGSIDAQSSFGRSLGQDNTYSNTNLFYNGYSVSASIPVFAGLSYLNTTRYHQIMRKMGIERKQELEDNLALQTMAAFYDVAYQQGMVNLAQEQLKESESNLKKMQRMEDLGMKGKADLADVEAKKAGDQYNLVRQQNLLRTMVLKLKEVMFYPVEEPFEIDIASPGILVMQASPDSAFAIFEAAKESLPAARALGFQLKSAKTDYAVAKGSFFPSLSFSAGISTGYYSTAKYTGGGNIPFEDQFNNNLGEYIGLSLSIPLFNNNILGTRARISKQNYRMAQAAYNEEMRQLQSEIQQAVLDREGAAEEFSQAQQREKATELAYKVNQRKYEQGLLSIIELHTSANQLLLSKAEKLRAYLTYMVKNRLVDYYKNGVVSAE